VKLHNFIRSVRNFIPSSWTPLAACIGVAALFLVPVGAQPAPQSARELVLTVGKSLIVNSGANIERVAVGFGDFAEARAIGPREVLLDGKAAGETSLIIWQEGGNKLFFDVMVRPNTTNVRTRIETLRRQIQEQLPGQNITANLENDSIFLSGTAKDMISVDRAAAISGAVGKVVNLLYVEVPPADSQILLKVQFATVNRNNTSELGLNLISTGATNTIGRATTGQFSPPTLSTPGAGGTTVSLSDALNFFLFRPDLNLGATIKALQTRGLFELLAEPNVLAINGKQASFLAGGEFPYPILQGGGGGVGTVTVAFREFGVRINFLPVITPRGTIRLEVAPEVSALDFTAGLNVQGFTVPGLSTRRVQTEIELEAGQSFAIGGLLDRRLTETIEKVPLLSSIPVLGKLFQSRSVNKQNNELLVIVTPEIVRAIPQGQAVPHLEFPQPLSGSDTVPRTPGLSVTGPVPVTPNQSIPVEKLIESLKVQGAMKLEGKDLSALPSASAPPSAAAMTTQAGPPAAPPAPAK
jgi:pilus assembly protein CpaC